MAALVCAAPVGAETGVARMLYGREAEAALLSGLQRYEGIASQGGWPALPEGPTLRPGMRHDAVPVLASRLAVTGDLAPGQVLRGDTLYSADLEDAVRRFQARHGLQDDALVGPATRRALNVAPAARVAQLRGNLLRLQGDESDFDGLSIVVNVPAFRADLLDDGVVVWSSRVIVGAEETPTPDIDSAISEIVVNPTWAVPARIAALEILPIVQRDPAYLARGGYSLYSADGRAVPPAEVEWAALSASHFPYRLVQQPGPSNQLGSVKFVFPNEHSVYLHDTPAKALFGRADRALSHGCIRLRDPWELAARLLAARGFRSSAIAELAASAGTRTLAIAPPVPMRVRYLTAEADSEGTLYFYDDLYGRDAVNADAEAPNAAAASGDCAAS